MVLKVMTCTDLASFPRVIPPSKASSVLVGTNEKKLYDLGDKSLQFQSYLTDTKNFCGKNSQAPSQHWHKSVGVSGGPDSPCV